MIVTELKLAAAFAALMVVALGSERVVLLIVVVPVDLPILTAVAAPTPRLMVVAPVLKRLPVDAVVVREPPLTAALPAVWILPVNAVRPEPRNE